jgi:hypothetical protein
MGVLVVYAGGCKEGWRASPVVDCLFSTALLVLYVLLLDCLLYVSFVLLE